MSALGSPAVLRGDYVSICPRRSPDRHPAPQATSGLITEVSLRTLPLEGTPPPHPPRACQAASLVPYHHPTPPPSPSDSSGESLSSFSPASQAPESRLTGVGQTLAWESCQPEGPGIQTTAEPSH